MARVTGSGPMPPVMWPHRSMPTKAGVDGSAQRGPCSAISRSQQAVQARTGQFSGSSG